MKNTKIRQEKERTVDKKNGAEDINFSKLIRDMRKRMEKCVEELKRYEDIGTDVAAHNALWSVYGAWGGDEYRAIEDALRRHGYRYASEDLING